MPKPNDEYYEEPIDVYSDSFQLNTGPFGVTLNFMVSSHAPPAPGTIPQSERLATVRMSLEHLKVMTFILTRQVLQHERETGVKIEIPVEVLNQLRIAQEDWQSFWR